MRLLRRIYAASCCVIQGVPERDLPTLISMASITPLRSRCKRWGRRRKSRRDFNRASAFLRGRIALGRNREEAIAIEHRRNYERKYGKWSWKAARRTVGRVNWATFVFFSLSVLFFRRLSEIAIAIIDLSTEIDSPRDNDRAPSSTNDEARDARSVSSEIPQRPISPSHNATTLAISCVSQSARRKARMSRCGYNKFALFIHIDMHGRWWPSQIHYTYSCIFKRARIKYHPVPAQQSIRLRVCAYMCDQVWNDCAKTQILNYKTSHSRHSYIVHSLYEFAEI